MNHTASTTELTRSSTLAGQINQDWWWSTFFLVLFSITFSFLKTETSLQRLDFVFYDYLSSIAKESQTNSTQNNQAVLIIIDDYSIEQMGHWPWRRSEYARLLDRLHLAKAVGVDIIFQDVNPMYPTDDAFLSYSIQRHGRVVLANTISSDNTLSPYPVPPLL